MYKLYKNTDKTKDVGVIKDNITSIPFDPANTDYQAYLKWLAEGNTPDPAENT
jgi:hypothetical protein